MSQSERCIPILELEGWAYYDPFIRVLYTIGPQIRASIRTLRFTGSPKTHEQEAGGVLLSRRGSVTQHAYIHPLYQQILYKHQDTCFRYGYGFLQNHGEFRRGCEKLR